MEPISDSLDINTDLELGLVGDDEYYFPNIDLTGQNDVPDYVVYCNVLGDYYTGKSSLIFNMFEKFGLSVKIPSADGKEINAHRNIAFGAILDPVSYGYRNVLQGNLLGQSGNGAYSVTYDAIDRLLDEEHLLNLDFLTQYETQQKLGSRHPRTKPKASCMYKYSLKSDAKTDFTNIIFCCDEQRGGAFHRNYKLVIDQHNNTRIHDGDNGLVNGWYPHPISEEDVDGVIEKIRDNESMLGKQFVAYDVFFVVYDITRRESFAVAEKLLKDIAENRHNDRRYIAFLVGNHADQYLDAKDREVPYADGRQLASKYNCSFSETSTLDNTNVVNLLTDVFKSVYADLDKLFISEQNIKAGVVTASDYKAESSTKPSNKASMERQSSAQLSQKRMSEKIISAPVSTSDEAFSRPSLLKSLSKSLKLDPDGSTMATATSTTPPPAAMSLMRQMSLSELSNRLSQDSRPKFSENTGVSGKTPFVETFYCNICLENVLKTSSVKASSCEKGHTHCRPCIEGYLCAAIGNGDIIFCCPGRDTGTNHGCMATFNEAEISMYSSDELFKKYQRFRDIKMEPTFRECPKCREGFLGDPKHPAITCVKCNTLYCYFHNDAHPTQSCTEYAAHLSKEHKKEEERSEQIVSLSKNCPKCKSPTVKNGGCNHMTCIVCKSNWSFTHSLTYLFTHSLTNSLTRCWICSNEMTDVTEHYSVGSCSGQQFIGYYDDLTTGQRISMQCREYFIYLLFAIFITPIAVVSAVDQIIIMMLPNCIARCPYIEARTQLGIGPLTFLMQVVAFIFGFVGANLITIVCSPFTATMYLWYNRHGRVLNYRFAHYLWLPTQYVFNLPITYDYFLLQRDHAPLETWQALKSQLEIKIRSDKLLLEVLKAEISSGTPDFLIQAKFGPVTVELIKAVHNLEADLLRQVNNFISERSLQKEASTAVGSDNA